MNYMDELNAYVSVYSQSEIKERSKLPEGKYEATVIRCALTHSQTGVLQLAWELVIAGGEYNGRHVFRNNRIINDADAMGYLKSDLAAAGTPLDDIRQLETVAASVVGRVLAIYISDNKKDPRYQNVYINKFVRMGEKPAQTAATAPAPAVPNTTTAPATIDDGDLPF